MDGEKVVSLLVCFIAFSCFLLISYNQKRKRDSGAHVPSSPHLWYVGQTEV